MSGQRIRRAVLLTVGLVAAAGSISAGPASAAPPSPPPPAPWLQTDYNAAGSRANVAETVLSASNVATLVPKRTYTGSGDSCDGLAGPVLSDSRTYIVLDQRLVAYDTYSGRQLWSQLVSADGDYYVSIAVSHGLVILGHDDCGSTDPNGYVDAYSTVDGSHAWSGQASFPDGLSGVVVSGQRVVAYANPGIETDATTQVLDVLTGKRVWSVGPAANYCAPAPYVVGGLAFGTSCSAKTDRLVARDVVTGAVQWTKRGSYRVLRGDDDTAAGSHLYVGKGGTVFDLDPHTGASRFSLPGATDVLAVDRSRVYSSCAADGSLVCAYDRATGERLWQITDADHLQGATVEADGVLYLGDGTVVDAGTGARLADFGGSPVLVANGRLVLVDAEDSTVTVYGLPAH